MNCNVIKDLMPLYAEDMLSRESRELVDEHVRTCAACRSELDALKRRRECRWTWIRAD